MEDTYLFIVTIMIIMLSSLFIYLKSKIFVLENKIQNINSLLEENNYEQLFESIKKLKRTIKILRDKYKNILEVVAIMNDNNIEKMDKINLKTDQLYKMNINIINNLGYRGVIYYYLFTQGLDLETTDFPLDYLTKDNILQMSEKYNVSSSDFMRMLFNSTDDERYEFVNKHLPVVVTNMKNIFGPNETNDETKFKIMNWPHFIH